MAENQCFISEYKKAVSAMGRLMDKMPEYKAMLSDKEVKALISSAVEQHAKYHAKRVCGLKKHPLGKAPSRRRKAKR